MHFLKQHLRCHHHHHCHRHIHHHHHCSGHHHSHHHHYQNATDLKGSFTLCRENAGVISGLLPVDALDQKKPDVGDDHDDHDDDSHDHAEVGDDDA